jgi:Rrf2 family iron-sulfur cluster assembly transcriptional regulator
MFSKACEYAIRATVYIAKKSKEGTNVGLKDIAKNIDSPEAFTAKILQNLVKNRLISSIKGPNGGFRLSKEQQEEVYLIDIVRAVDGPQSYDGCGLGLSQCSEEKPCPIHFQFKAIRTKLKHMLENTNMVALMDKLEKGETFLKL